MGMMSGTANLRLPDRRQPVFSIKSVYIIKIESGPGTPGPGAPAIHHERRVQSSCNLIFKTTRITDADHGIPGHLPPSGVPGYKAACQDTLRNLDVAAGDPDRTSRRKEQTPRIGL